MAEFPKTHGTRSRQKWCFAFFCSIENWVLAKSRGFTSTEKGNLFATTQEIVTFWLLLQLQGLVLHKNFLLGKPTEANSLKGEERAPGKELLLSPLTFHTIPNQTQTVPCPAPTAESFGTRNTEPKDHRMPTSLLVSSQSCMTSLLRHRSWICAGNGWETAGSRMDRGWVIST